MKMNSALVLKLKKLHVRSLKGHYVGSKTVVLADGQEQEVTVFSGTNCLLLGQYTPLGTIAIHENVFKNELLLNYILSHEVAHKKQWWKIIMVPIALFVIIEAPKFLGLSLESIWSAITTHSLEHLLDVTVGLCVASFLFAIPFAFSWVLELDADFHSIKILGLQKFLDLKNHDLKPLKRKYSFSFFLNLLTHPPTNFTSRIWQWWQKRH